MALDPQITSIKAAGTYRFEFDKSQIVSIPANQTRLIAGFSKKGPFNTPVFIPDTAFFKQVFGDIDRNLERKDSYFHRSCLAALERGPILALNLLSLDSTDRVEFIKLATSVTPDAQNNISAEREYQKFYNRDKFFFPDANAFLDNVNANRTTLSSLSTNDLLDFVNIGQTPVSIIVKKAANSNVAAFNVTVEEWYGSANIPGFLNKDSLISDFMVDVFVINGNFGGDFTSANPYERFEGDPIFQPYFDKTRGIKRKRFASDTNDTLIQEFFNESEVGLIATYTACLLPDFVDLIGRNLFIENVINRDTATTGLLCAVNQDLFSGDFLIDGVPGGIDLIGHNIEYSQTTGTQNDVNFLSYHAPIVADLSYARTSQSVYNATVTTSGNINVSLITGGNIQITVVGGVGNELYDAFASMSPNTPSAVGSFIKGAVSEMFVPVLSVNVTNNSATVILSAVGGITTDDFPTDALTVYEYVNEDDINFTAQEFEAASTNSNIISSYGSGLFSQVANGIFTDGDKAVYRVGGSNYTSFLVFNTIGYGFIHTGSPTTTLNKVAISDPAYNLPAIRINAYEEDQFINLTPKAEFNIDGTGVFLSSDSVPYAVGRLGIQTLKGSINQMINIIADSTTEPLLKSNQILIASNSPSASSIVVGNYLLNSEGSSQTPHSRLTKINQVQGGKTNTQYPVIPLGATALLITCQSEVSVTTVGGVGKVELYFPIDSWVEYLNIFTLNGFKLDVNRHVPNGSNERQNQILNGTLNGTNLFKALTDRETINFRYLVDTFGNGIETGSKSIYTKLCETRKNAFAIINAPSAKDFKSNTDPLFVDANGALSSRFISTGGDLSRNPTVRYSLPSANQGSSYGAFYYPFLTVRDLGKNIIVPPAAYISNNFIAKFETALPWSLVAGVRRGVVGGTGVVGLEINLDNEDRDFLEPFGLNPIIFQSGTGPTIFANKTAQQTPRSALSSINVREVVIYIQDGIEAILKNYLFEFNTPQTRLEIKTLADNFLSTVQNDDGIFDFRNVMDETNNTPDVIDNNIGILDTFIEPVRGMEILVQRTTILRTGAISTGNFQ
jgi:hypothetical protein